MSEQNIETVKKIDAAFSENRIEDFYSLCTDDVVWTMAGEKTVKGKAAIREWMKQMEGCEPPTITNERMIADEDSVAAYGHMSMKNKDGVSEIFDYCDLYEFGGGKVTNLTSFVIKRKTDDAKTTTAA